MKATRKPSSNKALQPTYAIVIECVTPAVDDGRYAAKRVLGDVCEVGADIIKDGHDLLAARVRFRSPAGGDWHAAPLAYDSDADRWRGGFVLDQIGRWTFTVDAWTDAFGTWRAGLAKKVEAGQDVSLELQEGALMIEAAARSAPAGADRATLRARAALLRDDRTDMLERARAGLDPGLRRLLDTHLPPQDLTTYAREFAVVADRPRAAFAAWYELFPRSQTDDSARHGTFADAERQLPRLADLGFDVVYLPPIHPIGKTFRKGKNNTLAAGPDDVGSPWAIGNEDGGHTAVDPRLGTLEDFERFVRRASELGLEIALDYALQCSPDHPWVREHPDWFKIRPDGSIQYAENPPKKYQDIYPLNFWCADREGLWNACRDVLLFWVARGVKTFRVDNPHTKPLAFWEWVIREVQTAHPDVAFLSEAFTRPKRLLNLAKLGFTQSYTYFTWKNAAWELRQFLTEFSRPEILEYYRGNFFANTPDILHEYLQTGGRAAFRVRLLLAATLSPLYGIYSGFELAEATPVRAGSEEYLDSEKYQIRVRDFAAPGNINAEIGLLNRIRRAERALQRADNLTLLRSENEEVFAFAKEASPGGHDLVVVVNLDPHRVQETMVHVPIDRFGLDSDEWYTVEDLLTGARYQWRGPRNYVRLDPATQVGHLLRVARPRPRLAAVRRSGT